MPKFSRRSKDRLSHCDERLQKWMNEFINYVDVGIVCGHRSKLEQDLAFKKGASKVKWPNSKHNQYPSKAIDIVFYDDKGKPIWDTHQACYVAGRALQLAEWMFGEGKIRWGGDWSQDTDVTDQTFNDYCHFELKE